MTSSPRLDLANVVDGFWFDAVHGVLRWVPEQAEASRLAEAARRVLDLDAEDFGVIAAEFAGRPWASGLVACCFPVEPLAPERGALASLVPLYRLMLEVLELRHARHEPLQLVVTAHLIGEYLPQLAWERVLGHGGDPARLAEQVGQRWGTTDRACPHNSAQRAAGRRAQFACAGDQAGFTAYLDKFHSRVGAALAVCGMNHQTVGAGERPDVGTTCPQPCDWALRPSLEERRELDARIRLALIYRDSAVVALRHHAPVGHFFGVPSLDEIQGAWAATWARLVQPWSDGSNPLDQSMTGGGDEALPGMAALVSAVAGQEVTAGRLIRDIGVDLRAALGGVRGEE